MQVPKPVGVLNTEDERSNYEFVSETEKVIKTYRDHDDDRLDFDVPLDDEARRKGHRQALPLSFFQIEYGDVEAGKLWYQNHFPRLSDDVAQLLARYNFGDLKYATKKSIRNNAKKHLKKFKKQPTIIEETKKGENPFLIKW
jgi:hypothetical protein